MANINNIENIKTLQSWDVPVVIHRTNAQPIDNASYFTQLSDAENYALSGATSYVGQELFVVNTTLSTADVYVIQDISGSLKKLATTIDVQQLSSALSGEVGKLSTALSAEIDNLSTDLSNAISSKIWIENRVDKSISAFTNLSVVTLSKDQYADEMLNKSPYGNMDKNVLYLISSDNLDMFGQKIEHLTMTDDNIESEAATKHYVDNLSANQSSHFNAKINALSANLSGEIDSLSSRLSIEIGSLSTSLSNDIKQLSSDLSGEICSLSTSLSNDIKQLSSDLSGEIGSLSTSLSNDIKQLSSDLSGEIGSLSTSLSNDIKALSGSLSGEIDSLSTSLSTEISNLSTDLSNAISSKVFVGEQTSSVTGDFTNLSVIKISKDDYEQAVVDAANNGVDLSNNVLYVISSDYIDAYGQQIKNVVMEDDNTLSEAATQHYVEQLSNRISQTIDNNIDAVCAVISNDISGYISSINDTIDNKLCVAISNNTDDISTKIWIENRVDKSISAFTNLSVVTLSKDQYADEMLNKSPYGNMDKNVIYFISSDNFDMFGQKIENLTMSVDNVPSEAVNKHYVDNYIRESTENTLSIHNILSAFDDSKYAANQTLSGGLNLNSDLSVVLSALVEIWKMFGGKTT